MCKLNKKGDSGDMTLAGSEYIMIRYEKIRYVSIGVQAILHGKQHAHDVLELGLVLDGHLRLSTKSGTVTLGPGQLMLCNAYESHTISSLTDKPAHLLSVWISGHFGREYSAHISNLVFDAAALATLPQAAADTIRGRMLDAAKCYFSESAGFPLECIGSVSLLLAELLRSVPYQSGTDADNAIKKKNIGRMHRISMYIEQHYKEKLTLSELAQAEELTAAYMSRIFRELFHMSFQEYLNLLRLERALPLLRDANVYLVDVCMECGFSDTRYLNSVCQKVFGCSATEYRKQHTDHKLVPRLDSLHRNEAAYTDNECLELLQAFQS